MKEHLGALIGLLNRFLKVILVVDLVIMTLLVFIQIIYRYILLKPIPWSEELARYLFEWLAFIGSSIAVKEKAHVGVEMFVHALPKPLQRITNIIAYIGCMVFVGLMTHYGFLVVGKTTKQLSAAIRMPMALPYLSVPLGSALMFLNFFYLMLNELGSTREA